MPVDGFYCFSKNICIFTNFLSKYRKSQNNLGFLQVSNSFFYNVHSEGQMDFFVTRIFYDCIVWSRFHVFEICLIDSVVTGFQFLVVEIC